MGYAISGTSATCGYKKDDGARILCLGGCMRAVCAWACFVGLEARAMRWCSGYEW